MAISFLVRHNLDISFMKEKTLHHRLYVENIHDVPKRSSDFIIHTNHIIKKTAHTGPIRL
jgi:hypothetical protein